MKASKRNGLSRPVYSNVFLLSKEGEKLSTISQRRKRFYLKNGLAKEVTRKDGFEAIQINFEPKGKPKHPFQTQIRPCLCVVCGTDKIDHISRHHAWVVPLCQIHHDAAEVLLFEKVYKHIAVARVGRTKKSALSAIAYLAEKKSNLDVTHPENWKILLERANLKFSSIADLDIPDVESRLEAVKEEEIAANLQAVKDWLEEAKEQYGGLDGVLEFFKDIFLELEPKFLLPGYLENHY